MQALAELLADPGFREIWEQELWAAFADPAIHRRFEQETGLGRSATANDPLHGFTNAAEREDYAYALAFAEWFNKRCFQVE